MQRLRSPEHGRQRLIVIRTMLHPVAAPSGVDPAVCVWKRNITTRSFARENVSHQPGIKPACSAKLGDLLRKSLCALKKNDSRGAKRVHIQTGREAASIYAMAFANVNATS